MWVCLLCADGSGVPMTYNHVRQNASAATNGLPNYPPQQPTPGSSVAGVTASYKTQWDFAPVDASTKRLVVCAGLPLTNAIQQVFSFSVLDNNIFHHYTSLKRTFFNDSYDVKKHKIRCHVVHFHKCSY